MSHLAANLANELIQEEERWHQDWAAKHFRGPFEYPKPKNTLDSRLTETPRLPSIVEQKRNRRGRGRKGLAPVRELQQPLLPVLPALRQHSGRPREDFLDVRIDLQPDEIPTSPATALGTLNERLSQQLEQNSRKSSKVVYAREREEPNVTSWGKQLVLPKWDEFARAPPQPPPKGGGRERRRRSGAASPGASSRSSAIRSKLTNVIWNGPTYIRPLTLGMQIFSKEEEIMSATRAEKMILTPELRVYKRQACLSPRYT